MVLKLWGQGVPNPQGWAAMEMRKLRPTKFTPLVSLKSYKTREKIQEMVFCPRDLCFGAVEGYFKTPFYGV